MALGFYHISMNRLHNNNELIIDFLDFCRYTMLVSLQKIKQETVYELQMI